MLGSVEDDGDTPRCACVALHRVGPKLALDSLGKWVLVLILRGGDFVVLMSTTASGDASPTTSWGGPIQVYLRPSR